jgi:hypothetical protein
MTGVEAGPGQLWGEYRVGRDVEHAPHVAEDGADVGVGDVVGVYDLQV